MNIMLIMLLCYLKLKSLVCNLVKKKQNIIMSWWTNKSNTNKYVIEKLNSFEQ